MFLSLYRICKGRYKNTILLLSVMFFVLWSGSGCATVKSNVTLPQPAESVQNSTLASGTNQTTQSAPLVTPAPTITPTPTGTHAPSTTPTPTTTPIPTETTAAITILADGFSYRPLDAAIKSRITGVSFPDVDEQSDMKISYDDLRYLELLYVDFKGQIQKGELIVNRVLADEVLDIFHQLYLAKYPLASVRLIDDFSGAEDLDKASMSANNSSSFFYRTVEGTNTLSKHALGAAIDLNPQFNPYVFGDYVSPENGMAYADRTRDFPGKIDHDDLAFELFSAAGWKWGGDWKNEKDYQHFQKIF